MSVVFAMLASYLLSRTLVPTMVLYLLAPEVRARHGRDAGPPTAGSAVTLPTDVRLLRGSLPQAHLRLRGGARLGLTHARVLIAVFLAFAIASLGLYPFVGRDFFPTVDAGQLRLHVRTPPGTRIEQTEIYFQQVEDYIRQVIPASELNVIIDNIGVPNPINLALSDSVTVGTGDGEILVALNANAPADRRLLEDAPRRAAAPVSGSRVLRPAGRHREPDPQLRPARPDRHQVTGPLQESDTNFRVAQQIANELRGVPVLWTCTCSRSWTRHASWSIPTGPWPSRSV
jgi:multidrug efflux pump subunit AcrB